MAANLGYAYSTQQIEAWLERIGLPRSFRPRHEAGKDLEDLTKIQRAALATTPFDDGEIHYTKHHSITLEPEGLFERMVTRRLGGYCMQGNTLFEYMTRGLGFAVYSTGARVKIRVDGLPTGPLTGIAHQVNIFSLADGRKFATDVSFGGDGPISPIPLVEGAVFPQIGSRQTRMVKKAIGANPDCKCWAYQIQFKPGEDWYDVYCFSEVEFLPQDFAIMNYWTSTNPGSWMTVKYVGVKMIIEDGEIVGKYTIDGGSVKKVLRGEVEYISDCKTETERIEALEKYFTVFMTDDEKEAIKGTVAELKG